MVVGTESHAADQLLANPGIDAVSTDDDVGLVGFAIAEMANRLVAGIFDRDDLVVEPDVLQTNGVT